MDCSDTAQKMRFVIEGINNEYGLHVSSDFVIRAARNQSLDEILHEMEDNSQLESTIRMQENGRISPIGPPDPMYYLYPYDIKTPCVFCKSLNLDGMATHACKTPNGMVLCPYLSQIVCHYCGATGAQAHTSKYCPLNSYTRGDPKKYGYPSGPLSSQYSKAYKVLFDLYFERFSEEFRKGFGSSYILKRFLA